MGGRHRVVDYIVEYLAASGVDYFFGVGGANIEDLYDAASFRDDITAVLAKHEFSAATMADGYSRSGSGLGVVAATSGGAALNTVPGLAESFASRVPVLALIGQAPTQFDGRGSFQDTSGHNGALNAHALFSTVSVYCRRVVRPGDIHTALPDAVAAARRLRGPAVLLLPKDIQQAAVPPNGVGTLGDPCREAGDPRSIARAVSRAEGRITIVAGEQVARDDARAELEELRSLLGARIATVPDAKDVATDALGVTGVMGHPSVAAAVAGSALCLLVGTRMTMTARAGLDEALTSVPVCSLGSVPPHVPCPHVHTDDLKLSLSQLALDLDESCSGAHDPVTPDELRPPEHDGPGVRYRDAMAVLDRMLPDGADIVVDAGNIGASAIHHLPARDGGRFLVALGMGGMGYGFGAGVGMAFGRARRTVVIAGDGAFLMHGMEIHTAWEYRLPITFLLFDNHAHAMCVTREQLFYDGRYSYNRFGPSRFGAGLAAMFPGLPSADVDDIGQLPDALRAALATDGPSVLGVECSADEIPPFAAFLEQPPIAEESAHVVARS